MARDNSLLVRFYADDYAPADNDRLWRELLEHAMKALGADSFSAQTDLLDEHLPARARQARESLIAHIRLQQPRRSFLGLKPPRWPLESSTRRWIEECGPWIYRSTIWKGEMWLLESELWGKYLSLVLRPEEWSRLKEKPWLGSLEPSPTTQEFRKEDERVRRGWALSRPMRLLAALATAAVVAAFSFQEGDWGWLLGGPFMGLAAYFFLPAREPGPASRLVAQASLPDDPGFNRRFQRIVTAGTLGALVAAFAGPAAYISDPRSGWRLAFWVVVVVGGIVALYAAGITTWWTIKYRR
jgi:hypothetical protein